MRKTFITIIIIEKVYIVGAHDMYVIMLHEISYWSAKCIIAGVILGTARTKQ